MESKGYKHTLGNVIGVIRDIRGLTKAQVARAASIVPNYLSKIEHDQAVPSLDILGSIAAALDTSTSIILYFALEDKEERTRQDEMFAILLKLRGENDTVMGKKRRSVEPAR